MTPRGVRNNNPGNLRFNARIKWLGQDGMDDAGFVVFAAMWQGVRALALDLIGGFRQARASGGREGEDTVREIINEFAPTNENDTSSYIESVANQIGRDPDDQLSCDYATLHDLADAIITHEVGHKGRAMINDNDLDRGVAEACKYKGIEV